MKQITFTGSGMLAGLATMLELVGHDTTDQRIALEMEAPYLLVRTEAGYQSGISLYTPDWLNLYLHPHGYHLSCKHLPQKEILAFLRTHNPVMLRIKVKPDMIHPAVFSGYGNKKYSFVNVKTLTADEPDAFSFSAPSLLRRLEEEVDVYFITPLPPEQVNFLPLLQNSLDNLTSYQNDLLTIRKKEVSFEEFKALRAPMFRALMQDFYPLICLTGDQELAEDLRNLNHYYRHVFTQNSDTKVYLDERLPKKLILQCIAWLKENIRDRIYELYGIEADT